MSLPRTSRLVLALATVAVAANSPLTGSAAPPVWSTTITVTCSGVTPGFHGNVAGNLKNHQGKKQNRTLELNGVRGFVFWGVPCGTSAAFTTRKAPDNAVVSFQTVEDGTGAVDCDTTVAVPNLPADVTHLGTEAVGGCSDSTYSTITVSIGTPIQQ